MSFLPTDINDEKAKELVHLRSRQADAIRPVHRDCHLIQETTKLVVKSYTAFEILFRRSSGYLSISSIDFPIS